MSVSATPMTRLPPGVRVGSGC